MKTAIISIALGLALLPIQLSADTKGIAEPREQTSFCGDDAPAELVLKPIPLPLAVLAALENTPQGKDARARAGGQQFDANALFKGTKVHLSDSGESFFVVMGISPLSGADNTWFWIVRQSNKGATVLLFAGANCLDMRPTKTLDYRDVVTTWSSASTTVTEIFKYDGKGYKLRRTKSGPNHFVTYAAHPQRRLAKQTEYKSPDGSLVAIVRSVWRPEAGDESEVRVQTTSGKILARRSYRSEDGEHGFGVVKAQWTPNSRYFVFSLESSGGHQAWHSPVEYFSRRSRTFASLDHALNDAVTNPQFSIDSPDKITVYLASNEKTSTVSLSSLGKKSRTTR